MIPNLGLELYHPAADITVILNPNLGPCILSHMLYQ
jgi:hypothetical protein